jgi:hypothetical protein
MNPVGIPYTKLFSDMGEVLSLAAETGFRRAHAALRPRRPSYHKRHPGIESPMWNVCATLLRRQLRPRGAKARLARYLGIPRQRLQDYLKAPSRLPDAELTLRMLHWLSETRAKRDLSL